MKRTNFKYILKIATANSLSGAGIGMSIPILPLWFELSFGIGTSYIGGIYLVYYAMGILGSYLARVASFRYNLVNVVLATRVSNGALLIAMALSPIPPIASAFYILRDWWPRSDLLPGPLWTFAELISRTMEPRRAFMA